MRRLRWGPIILLLICLCAVGTGIWLSMRVRDGAQLKTEPTNPVVSNDTDAPALQKENVLTSLSNVWDIAFLPDETLLFTERSGTISKVADGKKIVLATAPNVRAVGEGGLMGMTVDPDFAANRYIYACYNTEQDVRVSRWKVNADATGLTDHTAIITNMPTNSAGSGRHSGCRPRFGADGFLWVGTGDAAGGSNAQNPLSLGGKILRVDRDGKPANGNQNAPFDPRIYSYGHRNVQGLAMLPSPRYGVYGFSIEHGSRVDDEVNPLKAGNMGWNPVPGYNESVPMTDKTKYPNAIEPVWRSGETTIAPSGATFLLGSKWKAYNGRLAVAVLKNQHLKILELDDHGKLTSESTLFQGEFGRIRSAVLGPFNNLYLTTDNGRGTDKIVKVSPL